MQYLHRQQWLNRPHSLSLCSVKYSQPLHEVKLIRQLQGLNMLLLKFRGDFLIIFPNNTRSQYPQVSEQAWHIASLINSTPGASADQIGETLPKSIRDTPTMNMHKHYTYVVQPLPDISRS